ncbi:ABC transporter ATP-binding protein [Herbaspirillum sp. YR522]|uniref:ABC transporter ATP-binding protein n=1 Tax=Herbaspirillum sp. YR522 TaxID=1144342 RepID=UPI00026F6DC6|nr:ABC transporter ATP-binding protein [Herbaspirillum sp. YR522]EJN07024.1 ABC-type antimicrobial peptide transport system, ATPase component [Herbaspirillum sp. YR522]
MKAAPAIGLYDLSFTWPRQPVPALLLDELRIEAGQQVFISGPSGSGKSTLLAIIGGIVTPQRGTVSILGQPLQSLAPGRRDRFRVDHLGFIFQQFNLLPYLSVIDNVLLPCRFSSTRRNRALERADGLPQAARSLLDGLDLAPSLWTRDVASLSIGQQQRVAAARALIGRPDIIVADEPTSALDAQRQQGFLDLLQHQCRQSASALVFVSHDLRLAQRFDTRIALEQVNRAERMQEPA